MATQGILISGTSTGIGAAAVQRLAARPATRIYAGVRRPEDGERLVAGVDGDVVPVILDVTDREQIDKALGRIEADLGRLDGVVNNAGVGAGGIVASTPDGDWESVFAVNLFGLVALTRAALPLVARARGRFVHVGSVAGRVGMPR